MAQEPTTKKQPKATKFVPIPSDGNKIIRDEFGCTQPTVWSALHFITNSEQAISIREFAMQQWGGRPLAKKARTRKTNNK